MTDRQLDGLADLLLRVGVNLQSDQNLHISSEPHHWAFVNRVAERAYKLGARLVEATVPHPAFARTRIDHAAERHLGYVPDYVVSRYDGFVRDGTALLAVRGAEFPDLYRDVDQERQAAVQKAQRQRLHAFHEATGAARIPWSLTELPTPAWSAKVLGREDVDGLWELLVPILRLDQPDPVAAWRDLAATLRRRADALGADGGFRALRFEAPGTDLTVGLLDKGRWCGGAAHTPGGLDFMPNLPTEEVFTSPDFRATSGRARVTRPVEVLGHEVRGAWFEFENGVVTDYGAEEGKDRLDSYFGIDARARSLGEIALVDSASPIHRSDRVFHSILLDENAACHMALGSSYADTYDGGQDLVEDERYRLGLNQSLLHTDFMIGCDEIQVTGVRPGGGREPIIEAGRFTDAFA